MWKFHKKLGVPIKHQKKTRCESQASLLASLKHKLSTKDSISIIHKTRRLFQD
uniref:Uncharacterized protein n=1 Tax=Rhizophora mucronata TaxID=61149 RepID=A0A2P2Q7X0_RHIMU